MADPKGHLFAICSQWLPLAEATLDMVISKLPSPLEMEDERAEKLMCESTKTFDSLPAETKLLKKGQCTHIIMCFDLVSFSFLYHSTAFTACNSLNDVPLIVYISKVFPSSKEGLPDGQKR